MNFVFLSPHFPPHHHRFCVQLRRAGACVLGVAEEPYERLRPELREALTEYYRVDDVHDYDQLVRALGHLTHRSHEEVLSHLGPLLVHHEAIDSVFRPAIGDYGYIVRSPDEREVLAAARFIQDLA